MSLDPPTGVLTERLQRAIGGREVEAAVFTTFRFDPAFFEQEILPALFDLPLHHAPKLRLAQLELPLRPLSGKLAVYYDQRALVEGDRGSAALDIRRIPCWPRTGYFHPKNVLIIVKDRSENRSLLVLTSSANLTSSGWWNNLEAASIEELAEGGRSRMREPLERHLDHIRRLTAGVEEHQALDTIRSLLRTVAQSGHRSSGGTLHPHFYANGRRDASCLVDFLDTVAGDRIRGWNLDVISPYVDDADVSAPLRGLHERFHPRRVRVLLPEFRDTARCRATLFRDVLASGWEWGRMRGSLLSTRGEATEPRGIHAKVYRFFTGRREVVFVGSVNLTTAGHQRMGNVETGLLFERSRPTPARSWLKKLTADPAFFEASDEEEGTQETPHPLVLRYDWGSQELAALWNGFEENPALRLLARGVVVLSIRAGTLSDDEWVTLSVAPAALEQRLRSSSFLTVQDSAGRAGSILVLEVGMAHRPALLLDLTPAEILQYWALLTPEQRSEYIAAAGEALEVEGAEDLVAATVGEAPPASMFDAFAGIFHGFASLERAVVEALEEGRGAEAVFLLFGQKPDSLRRLVDRVLDQSADETLANDYLMLLCAAQLASGIRREWPDFWRGDRGAADLEAALDGSSTLRGALAARNDEDMPAFLDWHERHFLRPAKEPAA